MAVLQSVTQLSDSEPELGGFKKGEDSQPKPEPEDAKPKAEPKKEQPKSKPKPPKDAKPKAEPKKEQPKRKVCKRPAAANPDDKSLPENEKPQVPEVEIVEKKPRKDDDQGGYRLRPYRATNAMAIQATEGDKKQVLQVKIKGATFEQNTEIAEVLLKFLRSGTPLEEVLSMKSQMGSELESKIAGK
ncbi:unnamed protein product [Symbiodinium sp. CCMP2592]|nr:unnamed protein product [Symbiodinium sp. CCMP2592]